MSVFVDTSALVPFMAIDATEHEKAVRIWDSLVNAREMLVTSNYVIVETCALLQTRAGMAGVRRFVEGVMPVLAIEWVDPALHMIGINTSLMTGRHGPSVVDCVSFAVMRKIGIRRVFALDKHFNRQGFEVVG